VFVCDETGTCTTAVRDLSEVMSGAWLEGVVFGIDMGLRSGVSGRGLVLGGVVFQEVGNALYQFGQEPLEGRYKYRLYVS
jgi:hypothetical protein